MGTKRFNLIEPRNPWDYKKYLETLKDTMVKVQSLYNTYGVDVAEDGGDPPRKNRKEFRRKLDEFRLKDILTVAIEEIKRNGYYTIKDVNEENRKNAGSGNGDIDEMKMSTAFLVRQELKRQASAGVGPSAFNSAPQDIKDSVVALIEKYAMVDETRTSNEFKKKLAKMAKDSIEIEKENNKNFPNKLKNHMISENDIPYVCAMAKDIAEPEQQAELKRLGIKKGSSQYVGTKGKREKFFIKIYDIKEIRKTNSHLFKWVDRDKNLGVFFSKAGEKIQVEVDECILVEATVKRHQTGTYTKEKETLLYNVKLLQNVGRP